MLMRDVVDDLEVEEGLDAPGSAGLSLLAHALHALGGELGLRLDTFSLGPASSIIGEQPAAVTPSSAWHTCAFRNHLHLACWPA